MFERVAHDRIKVPEGSIPIEGHCPDTLDLWQYQTLRVVGPSGFEPKNFAFLNPIRSDASRRRHNQLDHGPLKGCLEKWI